MSESISKTIDDGGPAFPDGHVLRDDGSVEWGSLGLTMRDWFAGQAMVAMVPLMQKGLLKDYELGDDTTMGKIVASQAYGLADDMLNHRKKT